MSEVEVIYRSYRQGGVRYGDIIDNENGIPFPFNFSDGLYMPASSIWGALEQDSGHIKFKTLDVQSLFGNSNPLHVEIGMGNGEFIAYNAANKRDENWLGFEVFHEVFEKAVRRGKIANDGQLAENMRLLQFDAELFVRMLPDNAVAGFYVNFPDPWPKAKHKKRRLLKPWFLDLMRRKLAVGGVLTVATDHDDYASEITENFAQVAGFESMLGAPFLNDMGDYYKTKYYRKFAAKGTVYFYKMKRVL